MTTDTEKQAIAQTQAGYGTGNGTRTRTVLRQGDFKSEAWQIGTPKELAYLHENRCAFRLVHNPELARSCYDLPWFAVKKGTNQGQKHDTGGTALHRGAVERLVAAGARRRGFVSEMKVAFGNSTPTRNIHPDAFFIDAGERLVTLFEVVVTHDIGQKAFNIYRDLWLELDGYGLSLDLIMVYPSLHVGHTHRRYFDDALDDKRRMDAMCKCVSSVGEIYRTQVCRPSLVSRWAIVGQWLEHDKKGTP
jgi:hypothetical protein